jgi:hypothetical protein
MKELMGQTCLQWDTKKLQGAYSGAAYDPNSLKVQQAVQCETPFTILIAIDFKKIESHFSVVLQHAHLKILKSHSKCNGICTRKDTRRRLLNVHSILLDHGKSRYMFFVPLFL